MMPHHTIAIEIDKLYPRKKGESVLDVMNQQEGDLRKAWDSQPRGLDAKSPQMPENIMNMTIKELKSMGAQEVASFTTQRDTIKWHGKNNFSINPEIEEQFRQAIQGKEDEVDEDSILDHIGVEGEKFQVSEVGPNKFHGTQSKMQEQMLLKQHKRDDASIAIIMKALESGVELENDKVYNQMIKEYPHY